MKSNCLICKYRETCLSYQLGGLLIDTWCDRFQEEKEIPEEEQIILDSKFKEENSVKSLLACLFTTANFIFFYPKYCLT